MSTNPNMQLRDREFGLVAGLLLISAALMYFFPSFAVENNAGQIDPQMAAEIAQTFGIRIYTIGMGKEEGARIPYNDPIFGKQYRQVRVHVDEETLQQIAKITSAAYFRATDSAKLEFIYQEIDQMETTRMETTYFQHFRETAGVFLLPTAIALLLLEIVLSQTKLRRLP